MKHVDRYFELLPVLVIALILVLADAGREALRQGPLAPVLIQAPTESPRLIFR